MSKKFMKYLELNDAEMNENEISLNVNAKRNLKCKVGVGNDWNNNNTARVFMCVIFVHLFRSLQTQNDIRPIFSLDDATGRN